MSHIQPLNENFFFEEAKMKLYYHIKKAFLAQDVLSKKHQNPNSVQTIFTRQSQTAKADNNERN
jgi:hypothetical protein